MTVPLQPMKEQKAWNSWAWEIFNDIFFSELMGRLINDPVPTKAACFKSGIGKLPAKGQKINILDFEDHMLSVIVT